MKMAEAKQRYNSQKYLLLDTETTGLNPRKNAVIEIGAQILDYKLNVVDTPPFHVHVRPHDGAVIDDRALAVNNLHWAKDPTSKGYMDAKTPEAAWDALLAFLRPHYDIVNWIVPVGWNVNFDDEFLRGLYAQVHNSEPVTGRSPWPFHYHKIDLLGVVRFFDARTGRDRRSYKLEDMAQEYFGNIAKFAMHTALGDSQMCIKVVQEVEKEMLTANVRSE